MSDQNEGLGGSYMLDPATGQRTLVERTASSNAVLVVAEVPPAPPERKPAKAPAE